MLSWQFHPPKDYRFGALSLALHGTGVLALVLGGVMPQQSPQAAPGTVFQMVAPQQQQAAPPKAEPTPPRIPAKPPQPARERVKPVSPAPTPLPAPLESASLESATAMSAGVPAPASSPSGPQGASTPSQNFHRASYLDNTPPAYPMSARKRGIEGKVVLQVELDASGQVLSVRLNAGSGSDALDNAALETVRRWRFKPARQGGTPVASLVMIPIHFRLDGTLVAEAK